jgi:hypothetical protein
LISCAAHNNPCELSKLESGLIGKYINEVIPSDDVEGLIRAVWSKEQPGMFELNAGAHRLAVTKLKVNSTIYINKDLAINLNKNIIISQAQLIGILVHEFGHHLGFTDNEERFLDTFSAKIVKRFHTQSETIDLSYIGLPNIKFSIHNTYNAGDNDFDKYRRFRGINFLGLNGNFAIYTFEYLYNIYDSRNVVLNNQIKILFPKLCGNVDLIQRIQLSNLHWVGLPSPKDFINRSINAKADAIISCGTNLKDAIEIKASFFIYSYLTKVNEKIVLSTEGQVISIGNKKSPDVKDKKFDLKIKSINTNEISGNGIWDIKAIVRTSKKLTLKNCAAIISSLSFKRAIDSPYKNMFERLGCYRYRKIDNYTWEINIRREINLNHKSAEIYIESIFFDFKEEKHQVKLIPEIRPKLKIENVNDERDFSLEKIYFMDGKIDIIDTGFVSKNHSNLSHIVFMVFNSCKKKFKVNSIYFDLKGYNFTDTKINSLSYLVDDKGASYEGLADNLKNISSRCVDGKLEVSFDMKFKLESIWGHALKFMFAMSLEYMKLEKIRFMTKDHRYYEYHPKNFIIPFK